MMKKITLLLAMLLVIMAAGCSKGPAASGAAAQSNTLVAGTDASFPPFEYMSPTGQPEGFDVDLIKAIGENQKLNVEVKHTGWDGMMNGLSNGTVKIGIAGITITDDRKKSFDFTAPYFTAKQVILVKDNGPLANVKQVADLKGKLIGVQTGTTGASLVESTFGKGYSNMKGYTDIASAIEDLQNGRIQSVIADNAVIKKFVNKLNLKQVKIIEDSSVKTETYGIAVKKGSKELLDKLNKGLAAVKQNGKFDQLYKKYFAN
ncbi:basic amino acid ABC transporter substrate-binding protein [Aneurinibacillus sp. Ricciae_BoGa-3]|uniref:basic amino acid ABC transporter substrate-binding protein n=1 Tax=Aneurinibacillus sp. Ricciae_BoGa-3 TaxID=3022697 RepID=UPI0023417483|nr:basic amino acid ABC transporter substrate-binding protein [Aneurinibacillus sp. Ricciae_BoGa-3]WCK53068.1 basic amino acid ABC transporter substrate-binding protein [Aneurinibacillus sp. Ricciae_BoGa-3]